MSEELESRDASEAKRLRAFGANATFITGFEVADDGSGNAATMGSKVCDSWCCDREISIVAKNYTLH